MRSVACVLGVSEGKWACGLAVEASRPTLGLVVTLAVLGCGGEGGEWPPFVFEARHERAVLDNGLEVVVLPNHTAPVVSVVAAVRTGSFTEPDEWNGYSHLFEHMIFQGSSAVPAGAEFRRRLEALGTRSNATTSIDRVSYYFTATRSALEESLALFAGALREPALDAEVLENEKQVVLAEFDLREGDPDFVARREAQRLLFGPEAYRVDPLGRRENVLNATAEQLRAMHARYYVPDNAVLLLSGDIELSEGVQLASTYFADWSVGSAPEVGFSATPVASGQTRIVRADVAASRVFALWSVPSRRRVPRSALTADVLARTTDQRDDLFRSLQGTASAFSASLSPAGGGDSAYLVANLEMDFGRERSVIAQLGAVMSSLATPGSLDGDDLRAAQSEFFRDIFLTGASPEALPHAVAARWAIGSSEQYFTESDWVYGMTLKELDGFAAEHLRRRPDALVLLSSAENIVRENLNEEQLMRVGWP
jgi:zinc protease